MRPHQDTAGSDTTPSTCLPGPVTGTAFVRLGIQQRRQLPVRHRRERGNDPPRSRRSPPARPRSSTGLSSACRATWTAPRGRGVGGCPDVIERGARDAPLVDQPGGRVDDRRAGPARSDRHHLRPGTQPDHRQGDRPGQPGTGCRTRRARPPRAGRSPGCRRPTGPCSSARLRSRPIRQ
jgi:hypothetical protein